MIEIEPFHIAVPDATLDDLAARLDRARLPAPPIRGGGESEATIRRVETLIGYWQSGYDWRAQERRLGAVPQFRATVDGVGIHFVHVPGTGPDPLPLLLTNGWPSSFVEYLGVLGPLTDPAAHGGDPADSFSVVVPALPGYGFSDRALDRSLDRGLDRAAIAGLFHRLLVDALGYRRYVAHGDDIGGGVVNRLGMLAPPGLVAIQTANPIDPHAGPDDPPLTSAERDYLAAAAEWDRTEGAYAHVQATRPQILAYGLNDSPAGLAAWILEKWLTWTDPATRGRVSDDDLITTVMIYWLTETIGSSSRLYALYSPPGPGDTVATPTSVLAPHEPRLPVPPESWLRRGYPKLTRFVTLDEGGHFLALESPERFVAEIRDAFRPYR
jgi:pimeloyl-ACP methyl ester carboxylesterase